MALMIGAIFMKFGRAPTTLIIFNVVSFLFSCSRFRHPKLDPRFIFDTRSGYDTIDIKSTLRKVGIQLIQHLQTNSYITTNSQGAKSYFTIKLCKGLSRSSSTNLLTLICRWRANAFKRLCLSSGIRIVIVAMLITS